MISSFIICTKNRPEDLSVCINSIKGQTVLPDELLIVDGGTTDKLEEKLSAMLIDTRIRFIYIKTEPGLPRQRNIGVDMASGVIVFFLDDDVILEKDYLERLLEVYKAYEGQNLGGVSGTIINSYVDSFFRNCFNRLFFLNHTLKKGKGRFLPSGNYAFIPCPKTIVEVEGMSGCCSSYYRKVFLEYRAEDSWPGYALKEDMELSYRVSRKYKLYQTPLARLIHNCSPVARIKTAEFAEKQIINNYLMFKKDIPKIFFNIMCFVWSLVGRGIISLMSSIRRRNIAYLVGYSSGIYGIIRMMLRDKFGLLPQKD